MKQNQLLIILLSIAVFTSCRSFRQLSSNDNAGNTTVKKRSNRVKKAEFLDNIEVTPGSVVVSKHKSSAANTRNTTKETATTPANGGTGNYNMQDASYLQLKFSTLLGVPVEKLSNIALLEEMDKWWGTRYCMGGSTENCIDCSAFTQILMRDVFNTVLPRTSQEQFNATEKIGTDDLKEGDLVFFHTTGRSRREITHVGVYLQNNKFVHAASSGGVMISDLNEKYWQPKFRGGGRIKL